MEYLLEGLKEAVRILVDLDQETYAIIFRSLRVTLLATMWSCFIGIPLGLLLGLKEYPLKSLVEKLIQTAMSFPPVVIGLFVALMLSRRGPFGSYRLLFTMKAMMIAQTCLITPIICSIIMRECQAIGPIIIKEGRNLGARGGYLFILLIRGLKGTIYTAVITGFGRGISEVGAVMIVGGNIENHTRVMTTFIAMNNSMGNYERSLAMGLVLILLAFLINSTLHMLYKKKEPRSKKRGVTR